MYEYKVGKYICLLCHNPLYIRIGLTQYTSLMYGTVDDIIVAIKLHYDPNNEYRCSEINRPAPNSALNYKGYAPEHGDTQ